MKKNKPPFPPEWEEFPDYIEENKPPLLPHWWQWYALVTGWLCLLIGAFYLFTKVYS
ncbi:hypothetical protein [Chitinophaga silvisoli]|uniref:hypothetical protein n=1 Tax=Chitinophaga silvisoli TaxID=2291814 RepID=UPI0013145FB4|nr:hypothetical protein [Chitinophaga silvisoli]